MKYPPFRPLAGATFGTHNLDAFHTQRLTAQQILDQGGHYLMIVKSNQAELRNAIALLFDSVPLRGEDDRLEYIYPGVGHGRLEKRSLTSTCGLGNYLNWPGACQVLRRECQRINRKSGKVEVEVTYGITDLSREQALPIHIEFFWRGHWTIENRDHYVRDETMGEDRCQAHCGSSAQALAALRNGILSMFRYEGWENIAAAIRHFGSSVQKALSIIGAIAT
jgi:predicted transposase YbfD/YdcC